MRPEFVVEILETDNEGGLDLIGFFHSHPGKTAHVSDRDKRFMNLWPGRVWIIAGTGENGKVTELRAFKGSEEGVKPLKMEKTKKC